MKLNANIDMKIKNLKRTKLNIMIVNALSNT